MIIAAEYSFNDGYSIRRTYPYLLQEIEDIIASVDAAHHKIKESKEITMPGKMLYSPANLNRAFAQSFGSKGWQKKRITCHYSTDYYRPGYSPKQMRPAYRGNRLSKRTPWDRGTVMRLWSTTCVPK